MRNRAGNKFLAFVMAAVMLLGGMFATPPMTAYAVNIGTTKDLNPELAERQDNPQATDSAQALLSPTLTDSTIVWFGGYQWVVIGWDGEGIASESDRATLLFSNANTSKPSNNRFHGSSNQYAGSDFRTAMNTTFYNTLPEKERVYIMPRSLTGGSGLYVYNGAGGSPVTTTNFNAAAGTLSEAQYISGYGIAGGTFDWYAYHEFRTSESDFIGSTQYNGNYHPDNVAGNGDNLANEYLWPLSVAEASLLNGSIREYSAIWWLRSPGSIDDYAAVVTGDGYIHADGFPVSNAFHAIRPAFKLNLASVIFTSDASGASVKSSVAVGDTSLSAAEPPTDEIKLTVEDDTNLNLDCTDTAPRTVRTGNTVSIDYSDAITNDEGGGLGKFVSCVIADDNTGKITHYGKLSDEDEGTTSFTVPDTLADGNYTIKLFNEECNGDNLTDFASTPVEIAMEVESISTFNALVSIDPNTITFDNEIFGYDQPTAIAINMKNSGNVDAAITGVDLSGANADDFEIGGSGSTVPANSGTLSTWTVRPKAALAVGNHEADITVTYANGGSNTAAYATVSFTVEETPNIAPTQKTGNITQTVMEGRGATFDADDIAEDSDGDTLTITAIDNAQADSNVATVALSSGTVTITGVAEGNTEVEVTVADGNGGTVDITVPIKVIPEPEEPYIVAADPLNITTGGTGKFTVYLGTGTDAADSATVTSGDTAVATVNIETVTTSGTEITVTGESVGTTQISLGWSGGSKDGQSDTVNVRVTNPAPSFTQHPGDQNITEGDNATFTASASGNPAPTYQWQENSGSGWSDISDGGVYSGAATATLTLTNVLLSMDGYQYRCLASNIVQPDVKSDAAMLTVNAAGPETAPGVSANSVSIDLRYGNTASFSVSLGMSADGVTPIAAKARISVADDSIASVYPTEITTGSTITITGYKTGNTTVTVDYLDDGDASAALSLSSSVSDDPDGGDAPVASPSSASADLDDEDAPVASPSSASEDPDDEDVPDTLLLSASDDSDAGDVPVALPSSISVNVYRSSSGSGSDNSSDSGGSYTAYTYGTITVNGVSVSCSTQNATGIMTLDLTSDLLDKLLAAAGGSRTIVLNAGSPASLKGLEINFPPAWFGVHTDITLAVQSGIGGINLNNNLAKKYPAQDTTATVSVMKGSLILSARQSGKTVAWDTTGEPVVIYMPYTPAANTDTNAIVLYNKATGAVVAHSFYSDGKVCGAVNQPGEYDVKVNAVSYADTAGHWAKDDIAFAAGRGLISGATATAFAPDTAITRADFLMALGRLSAADVSGYKQSSFADVSHGSAAMPYIEWAVANEIASGTGGVEFSPDAIITREQMALMMVNYAKATGQTLSAARQAEPFADAGNISDWAKEAVKAVQQAGIITGESDSLFDPQGSATRAEASAILRRFAENTAGGVKGWVQTSSGQWQYIQADYTPKIGWLTTTEGNKYYFDKDSFRVSGKWVQIDGKWYYFDADGKLAVSTIIDGYEVGEDGARKEK